MGREALIPSALTRGPFTVEEARRHGLDRWHLQGKAWTRIGPATYMLAGTDVGPMRRLEAALMRMPAGGAFSGLTAAWLHGLDVAPCNPIEASVPIDAGVSARSGMSLRRCALAKNDVVKVQGMPATRIERTLAEVCLRLNLTEAVVLLDAALHDHRVSLASLRSWTEARAGSKGIRPLRLALEFVEPKTESPMESRLRMQLVLGGLPRPRAQVALHDRWGRFVGRPDLYYEDARLGIEYDGGTHRDSMTEDNRRQNKLLNAGYRLLRFTASDVLSHGDTVVMQVRAMLPG